LIILWLGAIGEIIKDLGQHDDLLSYY
jgi:hypothetical protein